VDIVQKLPLNFNWTSNQHEERIELGTENGSFQQSENNIVQMKLDEDVLQESKPVAFSSFDEPYQNQCPKEILERWREIGTYSLGNLTTNNHILEVLADLLEVVAIRQALRTFVLMRTDIEIKILTTSSPFHYGNVFVSHAPMMPVTVVGPPINMWSWSTSADSGGANWRRLINNNAAMLDVSIQNELIMTLKWPSPLNWLSLRQWWLSSLNDPANDFVRRSFQVALFCNHIIGKINSASSDTIPVRVFARLINTKLQGFTYDNEVTVTSVQAQSYGKAGVGGWAEMAMLGMGMAQGAKTLYDSFASLNLQTEPTSASLNAENRSCDIPDNTLRQVPDMWGDLVFNRAPQRTLLPYDVVEGSQNNIIDYIREPCYLFTSDITEIDSKVVQFAAWPTAAPDTGDPTGYADKISFISQYFRFWRGSLVFSFVFFSSPFLSAKIRIVVNWGNIAANTQYQEEMTRVISLRGSHTESIVIPYLYPSPWKFIENPELLSSDWVGQVPQISVYLMNNIESVGDLAPTIIMQVFKHAGRDFEFDSLRCGGNSFEGEPIIAQSFVGDLASLDEPIFNSSMRTPFRRNVLKTIESIGERYGTAYHYTTVFPMPLALQEGVQDTPNCDSIASIFLYFRGEMDFLIPIRDAGTASGVYMHMPPGPLGGRHDNTSYPVTDGMVKIDPRATSVFEVRVPLISKYDWVPLDQESELVYLASDFSGVSNLQPILDYSQGLSPDPVELVFDPFVRKLSPNCSFLFRLPPPEPVFWAMAPVLVPAKKRKVDVQPRALSEMKVAFEKKSLSLTSAKTTK